MRFLIFVAGCLMLGPALVTAQIPNTVSATASLTRAVTGGTATFQIQVLDTSLSASVDTAVRIGSAGGASADNLADVQVSLNQGFIVSQYTFSVKVAAADFASTRDRLLAAQRSLSSSSTQFLSWSVDYNVTDDDQAAALQAALPALLDRSRKQADALAAAMGRTVDKIVSLSTPAVVQNGLQLGLSLSATYSLTAQ